jgi:hypothetical protein
MNKYNKNNLYIFNKSANNNIKLIPFKTKENYVGEVKYLPPVSKEWKNSIYAYNKNYSINLPVNNVKINEIIQHYFNLRFFPKFIGRKYKPRWVRRPSMNKIYVSNTEIKHTNSKAILTVYTFNREKISLLNKVKSLKKDFLKKLKFLLFQYKEYTGNDILYKTIKKLIKKDLQLLRKYKLRLNLNKYKFEEKLLYKLNNIIGFYFNKKVEFNIVNMKSIILNSDIFTKILSHKLWKKRIQTLRMMDYILNKAVLPNVNRIIEKSPEVKGVNLDLIENKYKNPHLISVLGNDNLNNLLKELYSNVLSDSNSNKDYAEIYNILFDSIKYKNMAGVRLEVKGRLTKRYRADRAVFKVKWKGGLKNVYSSYKGLSVMRMRGYLNSNVEYSIITSKRRIGAFAVKGWVSGK